MGARFDTATPHYVLSRQSPPKSLPPGVEFVSDEVGTFAERPVTPFPDGVVQLHYLTLFNSGQP